MALRAELIGPYCLILVMCSVCAVQVLTLMPCKQLCAYFSFSLNGANVSAKIDCGCPQVY